MFDIQQKNLDIKYLVVSGITFIRYAQRQKIGKKIKSVGSSADTTTRRQLAYTIHKEKS